MTCGARIVQSSFDYETGRIGPYTVPIKIRHTDPKGNSFSMYRYYEQFIKYADALAVFNINNYCFGVLTPTQFINSPYAEADLKSAEFPIYDLTNPISSPEYIHIGYEKTYQECKAVFTIPWKIFADSYGNVYEYGCKLEGTPEKNPPLSLYKELLDSDADAVYRDAITGEVKFLKKGV